MKLKNILAILNANKTVRIYDGENGQWLSDGHASYPIYGLPKLNFESLRILMNVSEKQWETFNTTESPLPFSEEDNDEDEFKLEKLNMSITFADREVIPLSGSSRIFYIKPKYLKPFSCEDNVSYYARKSGKSGYMIAVKRGFVLIGVVMPCDIVSDLFVDTLRMICSRSSDILSEKETHERNKLEIQHFLDEDFTESEV